MCVNESRGGICRERKFPTYHKLTHHTTESTKYSQLQSTTYCYWVLLSLLRNQQKFAKCHAKTNHTSARVSDDTSTSARVSDDTNTLARVSNDTSSLAHVSDDTGGLACVSDDIGGPVGLWHVSPIKLYHVSLTHPQTPINRSIPKAFKKRRIQKYKSSTRIKPQSLQELQPRNRRTLEVESSKLSA